MKITCPSCDAKYSIADEKVQGKVAKIRCKKCGATIVVGGANGAAATTESGSAPNGAGGASYTVSVTDADQRTMTLPELVEAYHQGVVTGDTYVWADGMEDWQPVSNVPEVVAALHGDGSGGGHAVEEAAPVHEPEPAHAPAAARRESGRGRSVDLFGGAAAAGSEAEVQAPPASRRSAPPAVGGGELTGQRGEQSVLFSLNALTQAASSGRSSGPTSSSSQSLGGSMPSATSAKSGEDSGLIDLGALAKAAAEQPSSASAPMMMMPLGAPVLGSPMLEAPATSATTPPPAKSKTGLFIGIGLMLGMVCIAGAIIMTRQKPPETPTTNSATTTTPAPTPTETASAAPTSSAVDPTAATPSTSSSAKVVAVAGGGGKRLPGGAAPPPAAGKGNDPPPTAPPAATPKPPAASGGGCGCSPSDLMCNMACSAKKKK